MSFLGLLGHRTEGPVLEASLHTGALKSARVVLHKHPQLKPSQPGKSSFSETSESWSCSPRGLSLSFPRLLRLVELLLLPGRAGPWGSPRPWRIQEHQGKASHPDEQSWGWAASPNTAFLDDRFSPASVRDCFHGLGLPAQGTGCRVSQFLCVCVLCKLSDGAIEPGAESSDIRCSILRSPVLFPSNHHLVRGKGKRGGEKEAQPQSLITSSGVEIPILDGRKASPLP